MRLVLAICLTLSGCELDELLNPTPPCPKRIAFDTLGYAVIIRNGVRTDSIPLTGNTREVCTTTRQVASVAVWPIFHYTHGNQRT